MMIETLLLREPSGGKRLDPLNQAGASFRAMTWMRCRIADPPPAVATALEMAIPGGIGFLDLVSRGAPVLLELVGMGGAGRNRRS